MRKIAGIISIVAAVVMIVAGGVTWAMITSQLKDEQITVPADSEFMNGAFAGKPVGGPLSAFAQAEAIKKHATSGAEGTYAELSELSREAQEAGDQERVAELEQQQNTVMTASFLRSSLFTSVLAYGVSALVMGLGVLFAVLGFGLLAQTNSRRASVTVSDRGGATAA